MTLAEHVLGESQELGMRLALDDYGAGYSSMKSLYHIAFDKLKLDRSFVTNLESSELSQRNVRAVGGMCRMLELELVGEGVETEAQFIFLRSEGYDMIQGFYFSRPVPLSVAVENIISPVQPKRGPKNMAAPLMKRSHYF